MDRRTLLHGFDRVLRLQALCGGIALASWLIFWAVENPVTNIRDLFLYVLTQVNLSVLLLHPLKFFYEDRSSRYHWPIHVLAILAVNCVVVVASAAMIYQVDGLSNPFLDFLRHSWKFPFVANLVFAFSYEAYKVSTRRLRRHNQLLQRTIEVQIAGREADAIELQRAREIQENLLPKHIPQVPGFRIAGTWEPARAVGGDYYDVIQLSDSKAALCIADVSGKGISAALLMANVQAAVRAFATESVSPAEVCSRLNSVLCTNTATDKFVTLFYSVLDAQNGVLQFTNAGHLRPIVISHNASVARLENDGALLGIFPDWKYEVSRVPLATGDTLVLFTDGITEAETASGEEFGEERLIDSLVRFRHFDPQEVQAQLLTQVRAFSNHVLADDATLIVVNANSFVAEPVQKTIGYKQLSYSGVHND
ncbi:MAG TPA: PP2C family protein-serine/threonine phosphatase [Terriglobales bacterium]|nr:PP2C family protein-serine/threonine phosphatase [Terriglobales bacterium]